MDWSQITWESLAQPAVLGLLIALISAVLWKPLVLIFMVWVPETIPGGEEQRDRIRGLLTFIGTYGFALLLAAWRLGSGGHEIVPLSISAWALSTTEYELVKNVVGALGKTLPVVRYRPDKT